MSRVLAERDSFLQTVRGELESETKPSDLIDQRPQPRTFGLHWRTVSSDSEHSSSHLVIQVYTGERQSIALTTVEQCDGEFATTFCAQAPQVSCVGKGTFSCAPSRIRELLGQNAEFENRKRETKRVKGGIFMTARYLALAGLVIVGSSTLWAQNGSIAKFSAAGFGRDQ